MLDQPSYRESANNYAPDDDALYSPYTSSHRNDLLPDDIDTNFLTRFLSKLPIDEDDGPRSYEKYRDSDGDMIMDGSSLLDKVPCEVGATDDCPYNAECIPLSMKTRNGLCKCILGTEENAQGACVRPYAKGPTDLETDKKNDELGSEVKMDTSATSVVQKLTVSILSKEVCNQIQ